MSVEACPILAGEWMQDTAPAFLRCVPVCESVPDRGFYLSFDDDALRLWRVGDRHPLSLSVKELHQRLEPRGVLARACGCRDRPHVLDVMSGLGVDAMTMAMLGCRVTAVERSPAAYALNADLARRAGVCGYDVSLGDGWEWLNPADFARGAEVDVVYLDPMFVRDKSALPAKRMQYLAALADPDSRATHRWLERARDVALRRVVIKRRRRDAAVGDPSWQITAARMRFDVYDATPPAVARATA